MMRFLGTAALSLSALCSAAIASTAGILVANDSPVTLHVFLLGVKDSKYRGPYQISPRGKAEIDVPSGRYKVVVRRPDGTEHHLGWQDYSDSKLTFNVSLVLICKPLGPGEKTVVVKEQVLSASLQHATEYRCPKCGRIHSDWGHGERLTEK